jgi:hypothetical protein
LSWSPRNPPPKTRANPRNPRRMSKQTPQQEKEVQATHAGPRAGRRPKDGNEGPTRPCNPEAAPHISTTRPPHRCARPRFLLSSVSYEKTLSHLHISFLAFLPYRSPNRIPTLRLFIIACGYAPLILGAIALRGCRLCIASRTATGASAQVP